MALGGNLAPGKAKPLDLRSAYRLRDQLIAEYQNTAKRIATMAAEDAANDRVGTAAYRSKRLAVIQAELSALQDLTIPGATSLISNAYAAGATQTADHLGIAPPDFGATIHAEAVTVLADNITSDLNAAAETVGRRVADAYRREGLAASQRMLLEGETRRAASQAMSKSLLREGLTSFIDKGGRSWNLDSYTKMVLRTTTSEAATQGVINDLAENGLDLVEIAVADPCEICKPYEGNTYSLTGGDPEYEPLDDQPPFHPNCECTLTASTANLARLTAGATNA